MDKIIISGHIHNLGCKINLQKVSQIFKGINSDLSKTINGM
jgi:hypothetical protein